MSELKRWRLAVPRYDHPCMMTDHNGDYCLHSEAQAVIDGLKARIDDLEEQKETAAEEWLDDLERITFLEKVIEQAIEVPGLRVANNRNINYGHTERDNHQGHHIDDVPDLYKYLTDKAQAGAKLPGEKK